MFAELFAQFKTMAGQKPSPERRDRFYELAEAYDQAIIAHTRNQQLARMIADLRPHSARLRIIAHTRPDRLEVSLKEHLAVCTAIVKHNPDAAAAACTEHLANTQKTILDAVLNQTTWQYPSTSLPARVGLHPLTDVRHTMPGSPWAHTKDRGPRPRMM